jgi:hypothetical protein
MGIKQLFAVLLLCASCMAADEKDSQNPDGPPPQNQPKQSKRS